MMVVDEMRWPGAPLFHAMCVALSWMPCAEAITPYHAHNHNFHARTCIHQSHEGITGSQILCTHAQKEAWSPNATSAVPRVVLDPLAELFSTLNEPYIASRILR